ncbi:8336_t:CDS:2, partial [Ambispora leptoticha]
IMAEKACSLDDMCGIVAADILNLGVGQLSRDIIKNYYRRINDLKGSKLDKIGLGAGVFPPFKRDLLNHVAKVAHLVLDKNVLIPCLGAGHGGLPLRAERSPSG